MTTKHTLTTTQLDAYHERLAAVQCARLGLVPRDGAGLDLSRSSAADRNWRGNERHNQALYDYACGYHD